jgi:hypothetical protein
MWGMAMFTPLGLLIVMELGREWSIDMVRRAALTSCGLIVLVGIGFALHAHFIFGGAAPRTNWPMRAIASEAQSVWTTSTSKPLAIIGGTPWIAGLAAERRSPITICNLQTDDSGQARPAAKNTGMEGSLAVPAIREDGSLAGVLGIAKAQAHDWSEMETTDVTAAAAILAAR